MYGDITEPNEELLTLFKLWILSLVTSFRVNEANRTFKSEYILPQLIMLAAKELYINGVAYLSKRVKDDRLANIIAVNLALFMEYKGEKKLSENCNGIFVAPSVNFAMYKNLSYSLKFDIFSTQLHMRYAGDRCFGDLERKYPYSDTEFYRFDQYLFSKRMEEEMKSINVENYN